MSALRHQLSTCSKASDVKLILDKKENNLVLMCTVFWAVIGIYYNTKFGNYILKTLDARLSQNRLTSKQNWLRVRSVMVRDTWCSLPSGQFSFRSQQDSSSGRTAERKHYRTTTSSYQHSHSSLHPAAVPQTPAGTQNQIARSTVTVL